MQHVAPCKLFSQCVFLSSYEVTAGEDDKQAELPHLRMIPEQWLSYCKIAITLIMPLTGGSECNRLVTTVVVLCATERHNPRIS